MGVCGPVVPVEEAVARPQPDDARATAQRLIDRLAQQLNGNDGREADQALRGLRACRDDRLTPLLTRLASGQRNNVAVGALLGLAELSDPPRLDVSRLSDLDPRLRLPVARVAFLSGYLDAPRLGQIASWGEID